MSGGSGRGNLAHFSFLTGFSVFEKIVAFVYQAMMAALLGAGMVTDCFYSASQLFDLVDATLLGAIIVAVMNRFANVTAERDEQAGFDFLSNVHSIMTGLMAVIAVAVFAAARPLSYAVAPGFDEETRGVLVVCIRILCAVPLLTVISTVCQALLRQKKNFVLPNSRSLCISLCGIAAVVFCVATGSVSAYWLCIGYVLSNILFSVILYARSRRFGVIRFAKPVFDHDVRLLLAMAIPTVISKGVTRLALMVDQVIATTMGTGSITYVSYAHSLYNIVHALLITNLCMILLTDFTNACVARNFNSIIRTLRSAISSVLLLLLPVTLISAVFSNEIVCIAYQRGEFGTASTAQVSLLLFFYVIGFVPALLNNVYTAVLYGFGKMRTALFICVAMLSTNIVLSLVLSRFIGLAGIAVGTTAANLLIVFFYRRAAAKCVEGYRFALDLGYVWKCALGLAACGAVLVPVKLFVHSAFLAFPLAAAGGFAAFFAVLYLTRETVFMGYFEKLARIWKRKKNA